MRSFSFPSRLGPIEESKNSNLHPIPPATNLVPCLECLVGWLVVLTTRNVCLLDGGVCVFRWLDFFCLYCVYIIKSWKANKPIHHSSPSNQKTGFSLASMRIFATTKPINTQTDALYFSFVCCFRLTCFLLWKKGQSATKTAECRKIASPSPSQNKIKQKNNVEPVRRNIFSSSTRGII